MKKTAPSPATRWAAFLRGINLGGRTVKMADLKKAMESAGFRDVKTIGASGNVLFDAPESEVGALAKKIEPALQKDLGHAITVVVRPVAALRALLESAPFKSVKVTPDVRLYVTFLAAPVKPKSGLRIPYTSPQKNLSLLKLTDTELFSVVDLAAGGQSIEVMDLIDKEFGKGVTTRNWNTIQKLV